MAEQPFRLKIPSPDARSARSPFDDGHVIPVTQDPQVVFVPIVQWSGIRLRGRITGDTGVLNAQFVRPARNIDPATPGEALVYGVDQPAIDAAGVGTAWADGTEFSLEITAAEHQGENWLKITLTGDGNADAVVDFFDVSGVLLGTYH